MPKEWILNQANMRWQLTYKRSVGPVAKWIRECSPNNLEEWRNFWCKKIEREKVSSGENYLESLGKKLYREIKTTVLSEIDKLEEEDCINFIKELVFDRTYQGYETEIRTIYGELQNQIDREIKEAPDEWDRRYAVDYYIEVDGKYVGLQVKSAPDDVSTPDWVGKWKRLTKEQHKKFEEDYGGKAFMIFSTEKKEEIKNKEIIEKIKSEIRALRESEK